MAAGAGVLVIAILAALSGMRNTGAVERLLRAFEKMILIQAGAFIQGSRDGPLQELPVRRVHLDAFWIDRDEVSVAGWERFRAATGHRPSKYASDPALHRPELPIVGISWRDAAAYCGWTGKRLPTEAEWEKAARGPDGRRYPWGNEFDPARVAHGVTKPVPVGGRPGGESLYGARGMAGGVWEWTRDFWGEFYYREAPARNPQGPPSGFLHTIKGGSYRNSPEMLRAATRFRLDGIIRWKIVGFRCARTAKKERAPKFAVIR
ncbi:MAG: SUMF1/EgtB/PvdO family nonheme iron enzyme [Nitrospinota bacterium]